MVVSLKGNRLSGTPVKYNSGQVGMALGLFLWALNIFWTSSGNRRDAGNHVYIYKHRKSYCTMSHHCLILAESCLNRAVTLLCFPTGFFLIYTCRCQKLDGDCTACALSLRYVALPCNKAKLQFSACIT